MRATDQQVFGHLSEVVALLQRGDERLAHLRIVPPGAQRSLQLGLDDRHRGAQLVARVGHEAPLALERAAQAFEHLIERLAQAADLVVGRGQR